MSNSIAEKASKMVRDHWPASPEMLAMIIDDVAHTTEVETLTSAARALMDIGERKAAGLLNELARKKPDVIAGELAKQKARRP